MSSLEQCFDRNERLHSAIIPDRDLFATEPDMRRKGVLDATQKGTATVSGNRSLGETLGDMRKPDCSYEPSAKPNLTRKIAACRDRAEPFAI